MTVNNKPVEKMNRPQLLAHVLTMIDLEKPDSNRVYFHVNEMLDIVEYITGVDYSEDTGLSSSNLFSENLDGWEFQITTDSHATSGNLRNIIRLIEEVDSEIESAVEDAVGMDDDVVSDNPMPDILGVTLPESNQESIVSEDMEDVISVVDSETVVSTITDDEIEYNAYTLASVLSGLKPSLASNVVGILKVSENEYKLILK